jgi:hypothetical protein
MFVFMELDYKNVLLCAKNEHFVKLLKLLAKMAQFNPASSLKHICEAHKRFFDGSAKVFDVCKNVIFAFFSLVKYTLLIFISSNHTKESIKKLF